MDILKINFSINLIILLTVLLVSAIGIYLFKFKFRDYDIKLGSISDNFFKKITKQDTEKLDETSICNYKTEFIKQNSSILFSFFKEKKEDENENLNKKNNSFYLKNELF